MAENLPTVIHYVRVSDLAIPLHVHVLPRENGSYSWFGSRHSQELLVLVHEVTHAWATSAASERPKYEFRRSDSLRALLTFKPNESRQHLLVLNDDGHSHLLPCAGFTTEFGRRVLPYLDSATTAGSGYKPFRLHPDALHAYVDPFELGNPQGIFKIQSLLDPSHKRSLDIASYFVQGSSREEEGVLPEVPVSGLRRKTGGGGKRRTGRANKQLSRKQTRAGAREKPLPHQPTIAQSLASVQQQSSVAVSSEASRQDVGVYVGDLPLSAIDEFVDFDSQEGGGGGDPPVITADEDATLPLSPQVYSSADGEDENQGSRKKQKLTSPLRAAHRKNTESSSSRVPIQSSLLSSTLTKSSSDSSVQRSKDSGTGTLESASSVGASLTGSTHSSKDLSLKRRRSWSVQLAFENYFDHSAPETPASEEEGSPLCCSSEELFADELPTGGDEGAETLTASGRSGEECARMDETSQSDLVNECLFGPATPPLPPPKPSPRKLRSQSKVDVKKAPLCDTDARTLLDITNSPSPHDKEGGDLQTAGRRLSPTTSSDLGKGAGRPGTGTGGTPLQKALSLVNGRADDLASYLSDEAAPCCSTASCLDRDDAILISSGGEDSPAADSQSREGEGQRQKVKKKKKKPFNSKELFRNKHSIKELTPREVDRWLWHQQDLLVRLFKREEYSWRHEDFVAGAKKRASLQYQIDTRMFTKGQIKMITDRLMKIYCGRHMKFFSYTMSVLFPEVLVRLIADFHNVGFDEADVMMRTYSSDGERVEISDDEID